MSKSLFTTGNVIISVLDTRLFWGCCHEWVIFLGFLYLYKSQFVCCLYPLKVITHVFALYIMRAITNVNKFKQPDTNPSPHWRKSENERKDDTLKYWIKQMRELLKWEYKHDESQNHTSSVMHSCWHNCANIQTRLKHRLRWIWLLICVTTNFCCCTDLLLENLTGVSNNDGTHLL